MRSLARCIVLLFAALRLPASPRGQRRNALTLTASTASRVLLVGILMIAASSSVTAAEGTEVTAFFADSADGGTSNRSYSVRSPSEGVISGGVGFEGYLPGESFAFDIDPSDIGEDGGPWNLNLMAPPGEVLHVGAYDADNDFQREAGLAHLRLVGQGGCVGTGGTFVVKEIEFDPITGVPLHFAATINQVCESAHFLSEIRYRSTVPLTSRDISPLSIATALVDVGELGVPHDITLTNTGTTPLAVHDVSRSGPFRIVADGCTGTVAAGESCVVQIASEPEGPGETSGNVTIEDDSPAGTRTIGLSGTGRVTTTTILTSSLNPSVYPAEPTNLTATIDPAPGNGTVDFCVVGGSCFRRVSVSGATAVAVSVTFTSGPKSVYARFNGRPYFLPSESEPITQEVKFRPTLKLTTSQTSMPPGHPVLVSGGLLSVGVPGGTFTITDTLTGEVLRTEPAGWTTGDCDYPMQAGLHRYRLDYSGFGEDWLPASAIVDVNVADGLEVLPVRVPSSGAYPDIPCASAGNFAFFHRVNDPVIDIRPWATSEVILEKVLVSNDGAKDEVARLVTYQEFDYLEPISWSLIDPAVGGTDADGQVIIHFQFVDDSGRHGPIFIHPVLLDRTRPSGSTAIAEGASYSRATSVTVSTTATDSGSGVSHVALSNDGATWTTRSYAPTQPWTLASINGTRTVYAKWRDAAGNWSAAASDTIVLDTLAPAATAPTWRFVTGSAISSGRTTVRLGWTGSDAGSGIARYELAQQTDGGAWTSVSTALTSASLDRALAHGHGYRFRLRAVDRAGNASGWMTGPTFRITHYGETNSRIRYAGTWAISRSTAYWGGQAKASSSAGARATLSVTGRSVEWVARKGPTRGKAQVYVNGVLKATVDLYAGSFQNQRVVWATNWSTSATRTVSIRVLGTSGRPRVELDAIVVGS